MYRYATLLRDCEVAEIPYGGRITLVEGTRVGITQSLGGSFTATTPEGYMVRIAGKDADALGEEFVAEAAAAAKPEAAGDKSVEQMAWEQLRTCYDPEIPVNIVDLGLIYECEVAANDDGTRSIDVKMTLTAPGCGMGEVLVQDVKDKLEQIPTVREVKVELVFDPPWRRDMMSPAAQLQTGMM
jgi:probable FeS assembly SUF system protein SufT